MVSFDYQQQRARRDALDQRVKTEVCIKDARHILTVAFFDGQHRLRCATCGVYEPETRPKNEAGLLRRWQRGERLTAIERMQLERHLHRKIAEAESNGKPPDPRWANWLEQLEGNPDMTQPSDRSLTVRQPTEIMTRDQATRFMDLAKLNLAGPEREFALMIMQRTGLNPLYGEIIVYENKPMITKDGWSKVINSTGQFDGMPHPPRYLSKEEREARGFTDPDDIVVEVAVQRKGARFPIYALGRANRSKPHRKNPIEVQNPAVMAETRGFKRACRMGFQDILDGMGLTKEVMDGDEDALTPVRVIDIATGEIVQPVADAGDVPDFDADPPAPAPADAIEGQFTTVTDDTGPSEAEKQAWNVRSLGEWITQNNKDATKVHTWIQATYGRPFAHLSSDEQNKVMTRIFGR